MKKIISSIAIIATLNTVALLSCSSEPAEENTPNGGNVVDMPSSGNVTKSSSSGNSNNNSTSGNSSSSGGGTKSSSSVSSNNNSTSSGNNGSQVVENGQAYRYEDEKKYTSDNEKWRNNI